MQKVKIPILTIISIGIVFALWLFIYAGPTGDTRLFIYRLFLNKIHLAHEWIIPYFTPGLCGGFILAADPQDLLFSIPQIFTLIFQNQYFGIQFSNFFMTLFFGLGFYLWLATFGILNRVAKVFGAVFISVSGYWVSHLWIGHLTFQSFAFFPWVFYLIEKSLKKYSLKTILILIPLFFFFINSGQIWFLIFFILFLGRILSELIFIKDSKLKPIIFTTGIFVMASVVALLLSLPKLYSTYLYVLTKFPRHLNIMGLFGSTRYIIKVTLQALFDPRVITLQYKEPHIGSFWEWTGYIGIMSIPLILVGAFVIFRNKKIIKNKAFLGIIIACILQILFCRYHQFGETLRILLPITKGFSYYFRGIIIFSFFGVIMATLGLEYLLENKSKYYTRAAYLLMTLLFAEFTFVYSQSVLSQKPDPFFVGAPFSIPNKISQVGDLNLVALSKETAILECYNPPLLGYTSDGYRSQVQEGPVHTSTVSPNHFNLNDIKTMFGPQGDGGYYRENPWPLWPKSDQDSFEKFIHFKQVIQTPLSLRFFNWLAVCILGVYLSILGIYLVLLFRGSQTKS